MITVVKGRNQSGKPLYGADAIASHLENHDERGAAVDYLVDDVVADLAAAHPEHIVSARRVPGGFAEITVSLPLDAVMERYEAAGGHPSSWDGSDIPF